MRQLLSLLLVCSCYFSGIAQDSPKESKEAAKEAKEASKQAAKVAISTTGCTVEVFCFPGRFDAYDLEDGSTVYADDCVKDGITWGIYLVKLVKPVDDLAAAEDTVISYLDFMKLDNGIVKSKGYNKGHTLNKDQTTRGVYDTWDDVDKEKWKIKAWTNGKFIAVLYVHSAKELPEKKVELFLEGLRFPGMK
ncbi:hypothetical protein CAP36_01150 [Chitinophagaceae bacterium IBVUCB2]|nr:hypothetical protein CAP36_01150 [Chitinophagaceae bacterium IBVUCB2]